MENDEQSGYTTDLRAAEWLIVDQILGEPGKLGRPARFERRAVLNTIFYMVRTGGSWRLLPNDLPPWRIVYYYYSCWRGKGLWQRMHDALREAAREKSGKKSPNRCDIG